MDLYLPFILTVFAGLFATIDPLGNLPLFISLTAGADDKLRGKIALKSSLYGLIILVVFALFGKYIFEVFQITIPAFKIAGGILLFCIGFFMIFPKESNGQQEVKQDEKYYHDIAISPLAIPLIAGPSSIVAIMNFVSDAHGLMMEGIVVIFAFIICALTYVLFLTSKYIVKYLGESIINVISKLMGLILTILAVDMIIEGVKLSFNI